MNRRTNTALKIAGILLVVTGLGGALTGCGGSDSDGGGGSAAGDPKAPTTEGFCTKMDTLGSVVGTDDKDVAKAVKGIKDWAADMEAYGMPSELSGDARDGFAVLVSMLGGLDDDATAEDLQKVGTDLPAAQAKKTQAFSAWATDNCTPAVPSDDASPSGDAS